MALAKDPHHSQWWGFFVSLPAEPHRQRAWLWRSTAELGSLTSNRAAAVEFMAPLVCGTTRPDLIRRISSGLCCCARDDGRKLSPVEVSRWVTRQGIDTEFR